MLFSPIYKRCNLVNIYKEILLLEFLFLYCFLKNKSFCLYKQTYKPCGVSISSFDPLDFHICRFSLSSLALGRLAGAWDERPPGQWSQESSSVLFFLIWSTNLGRRSRNQSARELTMWKSILGEDEEQQDNFFDDQEGLCAISPLQVAIAIQRLSFEIPYFISEDSILA